MTLPLLDELEIHSGIVLGARRSPAPPSDTAPAGSVRSTLEGVLADALRHPPVHVAFSGGRDSSAILALATHVARREGLDDPIALTARHDDPDADETEWQELVIRHLGLRDWQRFHVTTEIDALGTLAVDAMRRHGPFWPAMAHNMSHTAAQAAGGTLMTGGGGDELLSDWEWRRPQRARLRALPLRSRARWTAYSLLPIRARQRVALSREHIDLPWLVPAAMAELRERMRGERQGRTFAESVELYLGGRYYELLRATLETFAADAGVRLVEPFYDPRVAIAIARDAPPTGLPSRTDAFRRYFGDVLPPEVIERSTKATFSVSLWGPASRSFAASWDGAGLDPQLVDADALRRSWERDPPDVRSLSPLQHAYWRSRLATNASR